MAMLFFLVSLYAFARWIEGRERGSGRSERWWWASLVGFVLAMLSKGSVAMEPSVLALLLWWRGRLDRTSALRVVPFLVVAVALAAVNVWFQHHGDPTQLRSIPFIDRILGAGAVVWFYLGKALFPVDLSFVYSSWQVEANQLSWWLPLAAAGLVSGVLVIYRRSGMWPLLVAWGYFALMLVPVMGFTDVYFMKYSLVADHYQHLALIGVVAAVGAGFAWIGARIGRGLAIGVVAILVAACVVRSYAQSRNYQDAERLFAATVMTEPRAWMAHYNLGLIEVKEARSKDAIVQFRSAIRTSREPYPDAELNLGIELMQVGDMTGAIPQLERAVVLERGSADAHYDLALALCKAGRLSRAMDELNTSIGIRPRFAPALNTLGIALAETGHFEEAERRFAAALEVDPTLTEAQRNLEQVRRDLGR